MDRLAKDVFSISRFQGVKETVKRVLVDAVLVNQLVDLPISPHTLRRDGTICFGPHQWHHEPFFGCALLAKPLLRNVFRLYTTIYFILSQGRCLGHYTSDLIKYKAVKSLHTDIVYKEFNCGSSSHEVAETLTELHLLLFNYEMRMALTQGGPEEKAILDN